MSFFGRVFGSGSHSSGSAPSSSSVPPAPPVNQYPGTASSSSQPPSHPHGAVPQAPPIVVTSASSMSASSSSFSSSSPPPFVRPPSPSALTSQWEFLGDDRSAGNPFLPVSAPPSPRTYFAMVEYEGKIYCHGGFGEGKEQGRYNDLRCYDIDTQVWELIETKGESPPPVYLHTAVVWNHALYVFGGSIKSDSNDFYRYQFSTKFWSRIQPNPASPTVPSARYGHAAVVCGNEMIIAGGCKASNQYFSDAYSYSFQLNIWKRISDIPCDIAYHSLVSHQGRVILLNGYNGVKFNGHIYSYTPQIDNQGFSNAPTWQQIHVTAKPSSSLSSQGTRQPNPSCGSAVVVADHYIFLFAGYSAAGHANDLYRLNLRTNEWCVVDTATSVRPVPRAYLQGVVSRGDLYILGGYSASSKCVSDFRRISVVRKSHFDNKLTNMLRDQQPMKNVVAFAMLKYGKHQSKLQLPPAASVNAKHLIDESMLEMLLEDIKYSMVGGNDPSRGNNINNSASPSSLSSFNFNPSPAAPPFYPFDTSRIPDLMELGFTRETCLECLEAMYARKQDTRNFSLVVEQLLNFTPSDKPSSLSQSQTPHASWQPSSISKTATAPLNIAPASNAHSRSSSVMVSSSTGGNINISSSPVLDAVQPPTSSLTSLQEQVQRLTTENSEMKSCKVCFDETIDCVLMPCSHLVVCESCAKDLKKRGLECPTCTKKVTHHIKVFWS